MSDLLKQRYVYRTEIELQNALAEAHAENKRLRAMQKIADDTINALEDQMQVLMQENAQKRDALRRLRDCDWVITPADRMDAVRDIAKEALGDDT